MTDKIIITIPSFRRPMSLLQLLRSIEQLKTDADVEIVVADNDAEKQEAHTVVRELRAEKYRFPLHVVLAEERGISPARNASLHAALAVPGATHVAMIDDDEEAPKDWLEHLLLKARKTGADIIGGPVYPIFDAPAPAPAWATECGFFKKDEFPDGIIPFIPRTSNLLVAVDILRRVPPPWFDSSFSFTSGEDLDFLHRAKMANAAFAWASRAVIHEHIPESRMSKAWLRQRAYRIGNCYILVRKKHGLELREQIWIMSRCSAAIGYRMFRFVIESPSEVARLQNIWKIFWHLGKMGALLNHRYEEYRRSHGR
ncbi:MAG: glycosyltransferase family 2 protein [Pseudomonadota bacterium]